jgi:hypothetical protein
VGEVFGTPSKMSGASPKASLPPMETLVALSAFLIAVAVGLSFYLNLPSS